MLQSICFIWAHTFYKPLMSLCMHVWVFFSKYFCKSCSVSELQECYQKLMICSQSVNKFVVSQSSTCFQPKNWEQLFCLVQWSRKSYHKLISHFIQNQEEKHLEMPSFATLCTRLCLFVNFSVEGGSYFFWKDLLIVVTMVCLLHQRQCGDCTQTTLFIWNETF